MLRIKRVDWLIATSVLSSLLIVWLVLAGFDALLQFINQLKHIGRNGYTVMDAMVYVLVTLPRRLYDQFNYAAMIGGLIALGSLAATGEMAALRAAGMSKLRISLSALGMIAILLLGVVMIGETAAPWGDLKAQTLSMRASSGLGLGGNSGLWARDGDLMINARHSVLVESHGRRQVQLVDVRVYQLTPDGRLAHFDWAQTGDHRGRQWTLHKVRSSTVEEQGIRTTYAEDLHWDSHLDPAVLEKSVVHPEYLPMRDLRRNMAYLEANGESPGIYASAFWARALYPLNTIVLVLSTLPFAFGALRSGGLGKRIFIGMLVAIGWIFLQKALINISTMYGVPPLLANLLPPFTLAGAAWVYFRKFA